MKKIITLTILVFLVGCAGVRYTPDPASVKQVLRHKTGLLVACRSSDCPTRWSTSFGFKLLDENTPLLGVGIFPAGAKLQDINLNSPAIVTDVIGPAQTAGLMPGDQIAECDGVAIKSIGDFMVLPPVEFNRTYNWRVFRGKQELVLQLTAVSILSLQSMDKLKVVADSFDETKVFDSLTRIDNRVDPLSKGPLYFFDLNVCNNLAAAEFRRVVEEQQKRALVGAISGAALGAGLGYSTGRSFGLNNTYSGQLAAAGASSGAVAGGIAGAASTRNPVDILIFNCMTNRGYKMLY